MKWFVLLGLVLSSSAFVKRDVGSNLFTPGKEYIYDFTIWSQAGSADYVSFASTFNITGDLHVSSTGSNINVRLDGIKFGAHNGEFDPFHAPEYSMKSYDQLKPLSEPFSVQVSNGKAKGIILNKNIDEWAHNIKRGIATALQLDLTKIDITKADHFETQEETVVGDCKTDYIVIPGDDNHAPLNKAQVRKFRAHGDCNDMPKRYRKPGVSIQLCADDNSRDVLNSTGFAVYDLEIQSGSLVAKNIKVGSTVIYNIFGVDGHTQHSFTKLNMILKSVGSGSVASPSNAQTYDDLKFEFENDVKEDEDLKAPKPFFFHHKGQDLDSAGQNRAADQLVANIKKIHQSLESPEVYKDVKDFHKVSPYSLLPFVSALDYQHLKDLSNKVKGGDETEYKIFLDALVMSGTGPAALVLRDIASTTTDTVYLARIVAPLPNYIRNPTENLLKELEGLIKPDNTKPNGRIIEFAFASLLGRTCKKSDCQKSGLLDKWVKYWADKIESGANFDDKTQAVIALRNVNHVKSAEKLLAVLLNKNQERSIRSAAMSGVAPLLKKDPLVFKKSVLPIFFDRQEDSELRNTAVQWTLLAAPEESIFQEVAIYMWLEKDPEVKNFIHTLFKSVSGTTKPCLKHTGSWAKTALQMLGPWEVKGKYSGTYISDYHDSQYNFGHLTATSVQKNGHSLLPRTVYLGFSGQTAGYSTKYLSFFIRLEGFGKSLASRIMSMTTGVIDFDEIKEVLNKIGVQERQADPLRIEIAVMLHNRVIAYHAADQKTITTIPQLMKKIGEMKSAAYDKELVRMMLIGGITTEQPNELGIPVSTVSAVTSVVGLHAKVGSDKAGTAMTRNYEVRLNLNMHGLSAVSNHLTPFGTAHSVEAARTIRIRIPRKISLGLDVKQQSVNFVISAPTEDDPVLAQVHATAVTAVHSDTPAAMKDQDIIDLLHQTCPTCKGMAMISKGEKFREERKLGSGYKYKSMEGINAGAKYYDCEKVHSRIHVLKQLRKFFGPENKNLGGRFGRPLTLFRLGARYMVQTLFLSPTTETCGMKAWYKQDTAAPSVFDKVEGQAKVKYEEDPKDKLGNKAMVKSSLNFKYTGATPKTRSLDMTLTLVKTGLEKIEVKTKLAAKDDALNKGGVVCVDVTATQAKVSDFFDYNGENEPTYERTINVAWSKDISSKDAGCPANSAGIKINKKAHRSQAQKDEAASDAWPYKQCREQKSSPKYPGDLTPATEPCLWATYKQTNLRESNITINYKVDPEARNRWRYPGALVAAVLMPYWVPSDSVDGHAAHGDHGVSADGHLQGELKLDVTMDEEHPEADIHWHGSGGESEHFHGVDLNFLPGPLKRPVHSRFSALMYKAFDLGVYGYCDVTPHAIQTFDNATYYADLSECYTLIAGDCSDKPRFVVLGKKISNDKLGVKILAGEHKVELNDLNNVIIDGKSQSLSDKLIFPEGDTKVFKIYKHDENNVFLLSKSLGLAIRYTGHYTTVTIGSRFRAQQCGLCGNFDGCRKNDFTGPATTCKNLQPSDMTKAYIVREGSCAGVGSVCPSS
ncbi:vitellogenin-like isoform X2 [Folsomia candida]|uniref:vitellogenin-like isoform X2 n=1 Tax=Folsomia candida TaxID=158441 RepID=UPI000B8F971B|nr:vitellogenin-like isoform X2 [Folsomia candida]